MKGMQEKYIVGAEISMSRRRYTAKHENFSLKGARDVESKKGYSIKTKAILGKA